MFTGIIEALGRVEKIDRLNEAVRIRVVCPELMGDIRQGDSVSVNGTCLTAIEPDGSGFSADVMLETLKLTSLASLEPDSPVNLERAMTAERRFGGHVVQGHVDGVGKVISRTPSEHWEWVRVELPEHLMKYVVHKGSIAIDGISLTVNEIDGNVIGLSLIPETLRLTTLGHRQPGDTVNIEVDIMAKHIERLLEARKNS